MEISEERRTEIGNLVSRFLLEMPNFQGAMEQTSSYQALHDLGGMEVIQIILERIQGETDENMSVLLFPLLSRLTNTDPVPRWHRGTPGKTRESWLTWGKERLLIK